MTIGKNDAERGQSKMQKIEEFVVLSAGIRRMSELSLQHLFSYLDRILPCCSPVSFSSDPHKLYHHGPRVGWCMSGNVLEFLHHKFHCIYPSLPKVSSLHSLDKEN